MPRNVLFIMTDQQHFATLGCHGVREAQTPNIDALAAGGLDFHGHVVTNPVCMPSRASIITGRYIHQHGVCENGCRLDREAATLPRILGAAGVETAHFGKLHLEPIVNRTTDHDPYGFDTCEVSEGDQNLTGDAHWSWLRTEHPAEFLTYLNECWTHGHGEGFRSEIPEALHCSTHTTDRAVEWLRDGRSGDKPFYLSVGYFDPHHAFNPCEPYHSRFAEAEVTPPRFDPESLATRPEHYATWFEGSARHCRDEAKMTATLRAYHAMCAHIDHCVGRLIAALEEQGLAADTAVIFTSDHGELMGNHGMLWKGPFMLDDLLRVPLIIAPGDRSGPGRTVDALSSSVDTVDTVCALLGVEHDAPTEGQPIVGGDLELFPQGEREFVLSEWEGGKFPAASHLRCVRTREAKLIDYGPDAPPEFYDLRADPGEFRNRGTDPDAAAPIAALREHLVTCYPGERTPASVVECPW